MPPIHLSSGLAPGWALGANDTSSILGPAVGSRMLGFRHTAICCALFLMLGTLSGGEGPTQTLVNLGGVNSSVRVFIIAFAAGLSVALVTIVRCPGSTVQAVTGAIIGVCLGSGGRLNSGSLITLGLAWLICPVLSAILAVFLYKLVAALIKALHVNIFKLDRMTRAGLFLSCAFASYELGANNIPAILGVFLPLSPFSDMKLFGSVEVSAAQQLFLLGGCAAATGIFTFGRQMTESTGAGIFRLSSSPIMAMVAVFTQAVILFLFTSPKAAAFLTVHGLPAFPLVPISGCQSLVGAMIGLSLLNKGFTFSWSKLEKLTVLWLATPILAGLLCWMAVRALA